MTKNYLFATVLAFVLSALSLRVWIPMLRKWKAGQNILSYVKEHKKKGGTPTMGGIAFVFASALITCLFSPMDRRVILALAVGLSYMVVGVLDDLLKKYHHENLGLRAWQKFAFQTAIALFCGLYCLRTGQTTLQLPFLDKTLVVGWWILPLSVLVFLATVNAVNLTDGLDGLASAVSVPFFLVLGVIITLQIGFNGLSTLSFSLVGALLAFLLFNSHPASVFMGDTGSLALGGFASAIAVFSGNALYVPLLGACFVFTVISVLVQVIYYKATGGKRVFLMSPVHHHFQQKGYSETKISYAYFAVTLVVGLLILTTVL